MSGWSSRCRRLKPKGLKSFTCDSWRVTCCLGNQATGDRQQTAVVAGLSVRATGMVAGEQLMADWWLRAISGTMHQATLTRALWPALRLEMSWSTPDRVVVRGFDLVDDLLGVVLLQCFEQRHESVLAAMLGQQLA